MAVPQPDIYTVPTGTTVVSGGNVAVIPVEPVWIGAAATAFTINFTTGAADFRLLSVDIPSTFSVTPGYTLPTGVTLSTVTPTQCRLDFASTVASGTYQFRIRATAL